MAAHIAAVRLKAFKSVGGDWQEFQFDRGLNAIVGPNGCGKSSLLDALCFAFAAPTKSFAVAALSDLANSDSSEVCEVSVQLRSGATRHTVAAALTPDGSRAFKVDGRNRSGKEVREMLRGLGVCLHSSAAVIKQAQVTRLADSSSPADLAALVAEASGLGRWNYEVAAAREELRRTRKALGDVQANLMVLERAVAADEEKLRALERLDALEHEATAAAQQMAVLLQQAAAASAREVAAGAASSEAAAASAREAQQQLEVAQQQLEVAQQQLAEAQHVQADQGSSGAVLQALQQRLAEAEEEARLVEEQQARRRSLEQQAECEQLAVQQLTAARSAAADELAACQQAQQAVAADLRTAETAQSADALQASLAAEVSVLVAAVVAKQQAAATAAAAADESGQRVEEAREELRAAQAAAGTAQAAATAQRHLQPASCSAQQQRAQLQQLRQQEQRLQAEAGTLAARLGGGSGAAWRPLHQCYSFRSLQQSQPYVEALQVLAGGKQGIVVADSLVAAGQLLAAGSGTRIWPLDGLAATDASQQQRRAAQHFAAGQVTLPTDLLQFEPRFRPAILRAFGSHVIAASDAVAAELVTRFGLPSVTLDGKVASRGTLQGGWQGGAGVGAPSPIQLKLSLDAAQQQLAAVMQQIAAAQAAMEAAEAAEAVMAVAEAAAAEVTAAEAHVAACQRAQVQHAAAHADAEAALGRAQADLAGKQQVLASLSGTGGQPGCAAAMQALQCEQQRLAQRAAELGQKAADAAAELAAAAARLAAAEDELALSAPAPVSEARLAALRSEQSAAAAALGDWQAELAAQVAGAAAQQEAVEAASSALAAAQEQADAAAAEAADRQAAAEKAAAEQGEVQQQLAALLREVPELESALPACSGGPGAESAAALRKACADVARRRARLLEERRRSPAARVPLAEQLRFREQQAALAVAQQQAGVLTAAAERLQDGIAGSSAQVLATNEAVFGAIATAFQSLLAAVLPAYRVRLRKVGEAVHEGVQLEFAHRGGSSGGSRTDEAQGDGAGWRSGLDVLSGGQRTLVSLTFVVAVAMAGAATSVFLMDEVDAALDETNQHLVAHLFDRLASNAAVECSQVLCVSHNAAFQQLCGRVVRLTRCARGTMAAADGGGGEAAGAGPGRSKKARNK